MVKIVCDEDDKWIAEEIVKAVQKYRLCPPLVDCNNPTADCNKCIAHWLTIEVVKDGEQE